MKLTLPIVLHRIDDLENSGNCWEKSISVLHRIDDLEMFQGLG